MAKTPRKTPFTIGYLAAGLVAVVIVGYLTYQKQFLQFPEPALSVLLLGLTGGLIYAFAQMRRRRFAALVIAASFLVRVGLTPRSYSFVAAAIYTLVVGFALVAGAYVQKSLTFLKFGRFISMGLILGAGYALMTLLLAGMWDIPTTPGTLWSQMFLGVKMGAAMGLGFELIDLIRPPPRHKRRHGHRRRHRPGPGTR